MNIGILSTIHIPKVCASLSGKLQIKVVIIFRGALFLTDFCKMPNNDTPFFALANYKQPFFDTI